MQAALALVVLAGAQAACALEPGDLSWVGPDSAVLRCSAAGSAVAQSALLDDIPSPLPPTGLLGRSLGPEALESLGFLRNSVVCAALEAPSEAEVAQTGATLAAVQAARREVDRAVKEGDRCSCEMAGELGRKSWLQSCRRKRRKGCYRSPEKIAVFAQVFLPVDEALQNVNVPFIHWRVFGRTAQSGEIKARLTETLAEQKGTWRTFFRGDEAPAGPTFELVRVLLGLPSVAAVLRKDDGFDLIVFREHAADRLVIDQFAYPPLGKFLRPFLVDPDSRRVYEYLDALTPPSAPVELDFDPRKGGTIQLHHGLLKRVDGALSVAARAADRRYEPDPDHETAPLMFDRISWQVPFSGNSRTVHARLWFSTQGQAWARGLADSAVTPTLGDLPVSKISPPGKRQSKSRKFVLQGSPVQSFVFLGVHALPKLVGAAEKELPGNTQGSTRAWSVLLPSAVIPEAADAPKGLERLCHRLAAREHVLRVDINDENTGVQLVLEPE